MRTTFFLIKMNIIILEQEGLPLTRRRKPDSFTALAYQILKKTGKPMYYLDITREILKIKKTKGKTPSETLRVMMTNDDRFVRVDRGIYGLKDWYIKKSPS